jgi:hypothetical protein
MARWWGCGRRGGGGGFAAEEVEEAVLAGRAVAGSSGGGRQRAVDPVKERAPRGAGIVEGPRLHQVLEHTLVDRAAVDPAREILEVPVGPALLALGDHLLRGDFADPFDCA